ncbi:amidohydrolase family protein [Microbacterium dextranolyticum]|uniref:amidohydrolase family protein n=1 Tax=Microbacterium dextranolyticum TaxID=36806 RepID=UPI00195EA8C1|nr:amidohydrolase family protein [Microbacterium dextranolyticum]MBM7462947.1 cytosine deaminase [Microbacterium dextranolyticum]
MHLPRSLRTLRNATLPGGARVDVVLSGETVKAVHPAGEAPAEAEGELDLTGFVLLTAAADPHAHLDKSRTWDRISPAFGDLPTAIAQYDAYAAAETRDSIAERARTTALDMLSHGVTAIRSHVNIFADADPLRGVDALLQVREELRGLIDLELCTLGDERVSDALHEEAVERGVDLIGGAPHLATDPGAELARLLTLAERLGRGVDMHTDESLDGPLTIVELARRTASWQHASASAGHCSRLGTLSPAELQPVVEAVRDADLGIITLPITNLYLQGWDAPVATPRGITAVRALLDAGVRLGAGADNVRDPFNPLGRCDPLETVALLVIGAHVSIDDALALVSDGSRSVMRLDAAGAVEGARAEFVAVKGTSAADVAASADPNRHVIHRGRLVSSTVATVTRADWSSSTERQVSA